MSAIDYDEERSFLTTAQKRRIRRKKLKAARKNTLLSTETNSLNNSVLIHAQVKVYNNSSSIVTTIETVMSSNKTFDKPKDDVLAARGAKKLAKQLAKTKSIAPDVNTPEKKGSVNPKSLQEQGKKTQVSEKPGQPKSTDEVDKALINSQSINTEVSIDEIKAQREAKKAEKQAKKLKSSVKEKITDVTTQGVADTLKDIANVAKEVQEVAAKVGAIQLDPKRTEESKSKAELKAERRAKQEAQRAAKQATAATEKAVKQPALEKQPQKVPSGEAKPKQPVFTKSKEEKATKIKVSDKMKSKSSGVRREHWFQHLNTDHLENALQNIPLNSNVHPAIVRVGVQQATRELDDPDARLVALLDALKKMIMDVSVGARAETGRALETALSGALKLLATLRPPNAAQRNAVAYLRYQITRLPHNVPDHEAKQRLIEEIDTYISEQVDKAGQTISETVRSKICDGDNVLTYGSSSLVERILIEAWQSGRRFHTIVVGGRAAGRSALGTLARLVDRGLPATYLDITALSFAMKHTHKVLVGCWALLATGGVVGAAGTASVALAARAHCVPLLAACPTARCSARAHTDAFTHNELGPPEAMLEENDALIGWRDVARLSLVNLSYDVTPGALVTAVATECAVLPCTSAPSVLRIKLAEYDLYASPHN